MSAGFEKHAWTVTVLTLVSRVTGLLRDATLSRVFGAGVWMDSFFFAFIIPNLFRRLFGEGALAAAFLPVYSDLLHNNPKASRQLATLVVARLMLLLGAITLVGEILLYILSASKGHESPALWLTMIMLPYMPLVCLVAMLGAMLQVHGRFGPTAASPVILNLFIIAAAVGMNYTDWAMREGDDASARVHVGIVAGAVLLAGFVQVAWSLWALRKDKWWTSERSEVAEPFKKVLKQAMPMIVGLGVLQLNTFFDGIIASYPATIGDTIFGYQYPLDEGAMAAVSFAQRLYQFPLGVFGIAVATAIFPLLSKQVNEPDAFGATVRRGLRLVVFIGLPASVGLMLVRHSITAVILQGGEFTAEDTQRVGRILLGYAPAIWAYSMTHVLTRALYAHGDAKKAMKVAVSMVVLNVLLNCTLIWTPLKETGLAWSTATCAVIQAIILSGVVKRYGIAVIDRAVASSWLRTLLASVAMGGAVWLVMHFVSLGDSWRDQTIELTAAVGAGMIVMFGFATLMRMPEQWWALGRS